MHRVPLNIKILMSKGILSIFSFTFQVHQGDESLLATALCFLEFLATQDPNVGIELHKNYSDVITILKVFHQQGIHHLEAAVFFCLRSLGCDVSNNTGIFHGHF